MPTRAIGLTHEGSAADLPGRALGRADQIQGASVRRNVKQVARRGTLGKVLANQRHGRVQMRQGFLDEWRDFAGGKRIEGLDCAGRVGDKDASGTGL